MSSQGLNSLYMFLMSYLETPTLLVCLAVAHVSENNNAPPELQITAMPATLRQLFVNTP